MYVLEIFLEHVKKVDYSTIKLIDSIEITNYFIIRDLRGEDLKQRTNIKNLKIFVINYRCLKIFTHTSDVLLYFK